MEADKKNKILIDLYKVICICKHPVEPRCRIFYFYNEEKRVTVPIQWQKCFELLQVAGVNFFITKSRFHLVVKNYVEKFERSYVRLKNFHAKVEVVKENIKEFEQWLLLP